MRLPFLLEAALKSLSLTRWQWTTLATLTVGYAGYYFCRSNFSVAAPLLLQEFRGTIDKEALGKIASTAAYFYAAGKLINGILGDFVGGRRMFLLGMLASIGATVLFGFSTGFTAFIAIWCFNRFVQSMGWGALVKMASRWFSAPIMGTVLGILCLSYLFGDVIARLFLSQVVDLGYGWRGVFFSAATVLGAILIASIFLLKASPTEVGEEEPAANTVNLFGESGNAPRPRDLWDLLLPFFTSMSFWLVCTMNFGLTLVRETFNFWTPTYLTESAGMTVAAAAAASALFPFFGGLSSLSSGYLSDSLLAGRRGLVMVVFLVPSIAALLGLAYVTDPGTTWLPLILISAIGFFILGPYTFLSGVISVDLGGKRGSSTAAGLADTAGYIGSIISGQYIGSLAQNRGWTGAFVFLAIVLALTTGVAVAYWYLHEHRHAKAAA